MKQFKVQTRIPEGLTAEMVLPMAKGMLRDMFFEELADVTWEAKDGFLFAVASQKEIGT